MGVTRVIKIMKELSNERLEAICEIAAQQARELIFENAEEMLKVWNESCVEACENEEDKLPPLKAGLAITIDLEKDEVKTVHSFTRKYQTTSKERLPDPENPELPMGGKEGE